MPKKKKKEKESESPLPDTEEDLGGRFEELEKGLTEPAEETA